MNTLAHAARGAGRRQPLPKVRRAFSIRSARRPRMCWPPSTNSSTRATTRRRMDSSTTRAYFTHVAPYEITSYSFPSVRVQDNVASLVVDLAVTSSEGEDQYRVTQRMVREDGSWRVVMREEQIASFSGAGSPSAGSSASASAPASASAASGGPCSDHDATVTVSRVVDGDTVEITPTVDGNEDVRLIGMDKAALTPVCEPGVETLAPSLAPACVPT